MYSKEEGTPAEKLPNQVHNLVKKKRHNKIMEIAKEISNEKMSKYIGNTHEVLIENKTNDNKYYIGRTYMDIPDTDGVVFVKNEKPNLEEKFIKCKITDSKGYDLIGKIM
jgi:ribosomal protein S12 methylthiotransferase